MRPGELFELRYVFHCSSSAKGSSDSSAVRETGLIRPHCVVEGCKSCYEFCSPKPGLLSACAGTAGKPPGISSHGMHMGGAEHQATVYLSPSSGSCIDHPNSDVEAFCAFDTSPSTLASEHAHNLKPLSDPEMANTNNLSGAC